MRTQHRVDFMWMAVVLIFALVFFSMTSQANPLKLILKTKIVEAAELNGLDPELVLAIAEVESGTNPKAIGSQGEVGIFQLKREYHVTDVSIHEHINIAVAYLKTVKDLCEQKYGDAWFIGYNIGPHYQKEIKHPRLFPYYVKVMSVRNRIASR